MATRPRLGDVVCVGRRASVQFAKGFNFRVIRVDEKPTYEGWCWLDGYQIDARGEAVERRSIFVQAGPGWSRLVHCHDAR
jgi:hypothetical protein